LPTTQEVVATITPTTEPTSASTQPNDSFMGLIPLPPTPPPPPTVSNNPGVKPDVPLPPPTRAEHPKILPSPIVSSARELEWLTDYDIVLNSENTMEPLAVRRRTMDADRVLLIDPQGAKVAGEVPFKKDPQVSDRYVLTPSGDAVLRVSSWPKLRLEILPLVGGRGVNAISLNEINGTPTLLGVTPNDQLLIQWEKSGMYAIEQWNLKTGQAGRAFRVPQLVPNGVALSPDGKMLAVATKVEGPAQVQLFDLISGRSRKVLIKSLDPKWPLQPVGLVFSPDSSRIAICFENDGGILAVAWNTLTLKQIAEHIIVAGMLPVPARDKFHGRALDWVSDSSTWLLYGQTVVDAVSGQPLGILGVEGVTGQHVTNANTIDLETAVEGGGKRLVRVQLNQEALAKARPATQPAAK